MNKKLLYFNLAVDENDTSLGFAIKWIDQISEAYEHVDVITLRKDSEPNFSNSVNVFILGLELGTAMNISNSFY